MEWFAFQKFNNFRIFCQLSVPFLTDSKFSEFLGEKSALGEVLGLQLIIKPLTDKWQMAENLTDNWQIDEITDTYGGPQLLLE